MGPIASIWAAIAIFYARISQIVYHLLLYGFTTSLALCIVVNLGISVVLGIVATEGEVVAARANAWLHHNWRGNVLNIHTIYLFEQVENCSLESRNSFPPFHYYSTLSTWNDLRPRYHGS